MKISHLTFAITLIGLLAACSSNPTDTPGESDPTPSITSFGANPNPVPVNIASQFSWSLTGEGLICQLDVDNNGTTEYTVQNCTSASRVSHQYPALGKYMARLSVTSAGGVVLSETTPVEVGAANQAPIPVLKAGVGGPADQPLAVKFSWTVSDPNSDVTRCQLDADGDGRWEYDALCSGLTAQNVGPSDQVSYVYTHVYSQVGKYSAVLLASDAYQGNESRVEVRVPLNRAPIIEELEATVESGRLKVVYKVSDPDLDAVACVVKIEGIGQYVYDDCRSPIQTYPTAGKNQFEITLEATDPYQTTTRFLNFRPQACKAIQNADWSNNSPEKPDQYHLLNNRESLWLTALAISPDCRRVVGATVTGRFLMWEYGNLSAEPTYFGVQGTGPNFVEHLEFSPDSRYLVATGCLVNGIIIGQTPQATVWDLSGASPRQLNTNFTTLTICSAAFSPDGATLALGFTDLGSSGGIFFMRGSNPSLVREVKDTAGGVFALEYSPNGNLLVASEVQLAPVSVQDPEMDLPTLPSPYSAGTWSGWKTKDVGPLFGYTAIRFYDGRDPADPLYFVTDLPPGLINTVLKFAPDSSYLVGMASFYILSSPWMLPMEGDVPQSGGAYQLNLPVPYLILTTTLDVSPDSRWVALPSFVQAESPTYMYNARTGRTEGEYLSDTYAVFSPDNRWLFGSYISEKGPSMGVFSR